MTDHGKPDDLTEREQWAWREAEFCDQMADGMRKSAREWVETSFHSSRLEGALKCAVSAECWEQMAWHLRMPIYSARERHS